MTKRSLAKRSLAMRSTSFVGHPFAIGRSSPARGSMEGLQQVDLRLHALEMRPASAIPSAVLAAVDEARRMTALTRDRLVFIDELPNAAVMPTVLAIAADARRAREINGHPVLFLDELPNAADAPGWYDEDGRFHPPMGEAGAAALRGMMQDRRTKDHVLPI